MQFAEQDPNDGLSPVVQYISGDFAYINLWATHSQETNIDDIDVFLEPPGMMLAVAANEALRGRPPFTSPPQSPLGERPCLEVPSVLSGMSGESRLCLAYFLVNDQERFTGWEIDWKWPTSPPSISAEITRNESPYTYVY